MSNIGIIIPERPRDIGNFMVGRLLPFHSKRMVGPFIFIDHMGPLAMNDHRNMDVGPHPHTGLSTLTFLFEGALLHRDSLGTVQEITPGAVNWMTAGHGIVHSERTPGRLRGVDKPMHGLQIWVALPKEAEDVAPSFHHIGAEALPAWERDGSRFRLVAGEVMGHRSPVPVHSKLYMLEIHSGAGGEMRVGAELYGEVGLYVLHGSVREGSDGEPIGERQILVAKDPKLCAFTMAPGTTVYLFGGEPFPEERFIYWNFVATSPEKLEEAKQRWRDRRFPAVPGETGYIVMPERRR